MTKAHRDESKSDSINQYSLFMSLFADNTDQSADPCTVYWEKDGSDGRVGGTVFPLTYHPCGGGRRLRQRVSRRNG
jgi:hypothetical protein